MAQAANISPPGTDGTDASPTSTTATVTQTNPARMNATVRAVGARASRPCHQVPRAQVSPEQASGRPANVAPYPCCSVSASGTTDSPPNTAPASRPRSAMGAGTPGRARRVPTGSSTRSPQPVATRPSPASSPVTRDGCWPHDSIAATPRATARARRTRRGSVRAAVPACGRVRMRPMTGRIMAEPMATNGTSPRNTQRQPRCWVSAPASSGPTSEGRTQAVEMAVKIFGRWVSTYCSPIRTYIAVISRPEARPCTTRPSTKIHIAGANPLTSRPPVNSTRPVVMGSRGPRASLSWPLTTIPTMLAIRNPVKAQP